MAKRNVPSPENFTMRLLPPRCPSDTQMSPSGETTTPDGPLKCDSSSPQTPASPSRMTTSPCWFSFSTWWPMPMLSPSAARRSPCDPPSVTHRKPSWSRKKPWGKAKSPAPKLSTRLPSRSNFMMGFRSVPAHSLAPHRSRIQRCCPSGSGKTPLTVPMTRPSGSFSQPKVARQGFVVDDCAQTPPAPSRTTISTAAGIHPMRPDLGMETSLACGVRPARRRCIPGDEQCLGSSPQGVDKLVNDSPS